MGDLDWKEVKQFVSAGQAFVPVNLANRGDSVELFFRDGETKQLDMQSSLFLKRLLTFFGTSAAINRHWYGELVGKKQLVPIVLSYGFTIIPFNVREPIGRQSSGHHGAHRHPFPPQNVRLFRIQTGNRPGHDPKNPQPLQPGRNAPLHRHHPRTN
jgi:hypothetical protein